jgi:hypothetical protein
MKPMVHQDSWLLKILPPAADSPANTPPTVKWERRKKPVNSPNPPRAGATMAHHKGRGIAFGGVHDVEESEEGMDSEFFNFLNAFNIDRNRFFLLTLRRQRAAPAKKAGGNERSTRRGGRGKADEEELLRNLALIEKRLGTTSNENAENADPEDSDSDSDSSDDGKTKVEKPIHWEMPHPRFNAQLAVQDDTLYIYGGTYEKGDREFTFDELWAIDLGKLDGVKEIYRRELEDWQGSEDEDDDEEDEDDEDEYEDEEDSDDEGKAEEAAHSTPATSVAAADEERPTAVEDEDEEDESSTKAKEEEEEDTTPSPRPFESLRQFFSRTSQDWQAVILHKMQYERDAAANPSSVKEIRKRAFDLAEAKWWDAREEIQALEEEQMEAGIGDVVSLDARHGEGGAGKGGAGRRR